MVAPGADVTRRIGRKSKLISVHFSLRARHILANRFTSSFFRSDHQRDACVLQAEPRQLSWRRSCCGCSGQSAERRTLLSDRRSRKFYVCRALDPFPMLDLCRDEHVTFFEECRTLTDLIRAYFECASIGLHFTDHFLPESLMSDLRVDRRWRNFRRRARFNMTKRR